MTSPTILQGYSYPLTSLANVLATEAYEGRTVRIAIQHAGGWAVSGEDATGDRLAGELLAALEGILAVASTRELYTSKLK